MAKDQTYFNEGKQAYWAGEEMEDPPYHPQDRRCLDWIDGWKSSKKDEEQGLDIFGEPSVCGSMYDVVHEQHEDELDLQAEEEDREAERYNRNVMDDDSYYYRHDENHQFGVLFAL